MEQLLLFTSLSEGGFEGGEDTEDSHHSISPSLSLTASHVECKVNILKAAAECEALGKPVVESLLMFLICFEKWGFSHLLYSENSE